MPDNQTLDLTLYVMIVGAALSVVAELFPAWRGMAPERKRVVVYAGAALLGIGVWAAVTYLPAALLQQLEAPVKLLLSALLAVGSSQATHAIRKQLKPARPPAS